MAVYTPREDSFLVKNYLEDKDLLGKKVLDVGTGSGILALEAARGDGEVTAIDINPEAISYAREEAIEDGLGNRIEFLESDLFENVEGKFDLIVFNPPYLPGQEGIGNEEIWRGGGKGIEVTERFLKKAPNYLADNGEILVVLSSHTDFSEIKEEYDLKIIGSKKIWFETLYLATSK